MRKISSEYENPIDNIILHFADYSLPLFGNLTPNQLTTFSVLFRIISLYFLLTPSSSSNLLFLLFAIIGHVFDCLDGHVARTKKLETKFGDWYDHMNDLVYHVILIYLIFTSSTLLQFDPTTKMLLIGGYSLLVFLCLVHIGCQEKIFDSKEKSTLSFTRGLCSNQTMINYTKYFGCGTTCFVLYIFIFLFYRA